MFRVDRKAVGSRHSREAVKPRETDPIQPHHLQVSAASGGLLEARSPVSQMTFRRALLHGIGSEAVPSNLPIINAWNEEACHSSNGNVLLNCSYPYLALYRAHRPAKAPCRSYLPMVTLGYIRNNKLTLIPSRISPAVAPSVASGSKRTNKMTAPFDVYSERLYPRSETSTVRGDDASIAPSQAETLTPERDEMMRFTATGRP